MRIATQWLNELEDQIQQVSGVPVYCSVPDASPYLGRQVRIVFPMEAEIRVQKALRQSWDDLSALVPQQYRKRRWILRLYHLAHERFAVLSSEEDGFFVSTNIQNLNDPLKKPLGSLVQMTYNVDAIVVAVRRGPADMQEFGERIREIATAFNDESRYLRIGQLRCAFTDSRFVAPGVQLRFQPLTLSA